MIKTLKLISEHLDKSKIFAGVLIIILNIGSRIIPISLNKTTENFLKTVVPRDLIIFAIAWMGTRDVFIALLLTVAFICIFDYLLNFESKMCCLPLKYKCVETDTEISDEELNKAISVLEKSKKKKLLENQHETYTRLFS
jgi:hypothetical protein